MATKALVAASSKPLILSILAHGENYGYRIIKEVEHRSEGTLQWTDAMLYPVLHRLEKEGLVRSRWVQQESGRKRKYYALTPAGKEALATEKAQWRDVDQALRSLWQSAAEDGLDTV